MHRSCPCPRVHMWIIIKKYRSSIHSFDFVLLWFSQNTNSWKVPGVSISIFFFFNESVVYFWLDKNNITKKNVSRWTHTHALARMICVRVRSNGTNNNLQFHKSLKNELRPFWWRFFGIYEFQTAAGVYSTNLIFRKTPH